MRVAILFFSNGRDSNKLRAITDGLAQGIMAQGNQTDVIDGKEIRKIAFYDYIAIGTVQNTTFSGKISPNIAKCLSASGPLIGKRSFAYVVRNVIGSGRALARLMAAMENEGMIIRNSAALKSTYEATQIGKRIHVTQ